MVTPKDISYHSHDAARINLYWSLLKQSPEYWNQLHNLPHNICMEI